MINHKRIRGNDGLHRMWDPEKIKEHYWKNGLI